MQGSKRRPALTEAHLAKVARTIADKGPTPGVEQQTDEDYQGWVRRTLASHPEPGKPIRLFAYGSLIWKPEIALGASQIGTARGWHRSFCLRLQRFRGTVEQPGLMMALDRGGQCRGMLFELPPGDPEGQLHLLFRREFTVKPISNVPRWIRVETAEAGGWALTFVINRLSPNYAGRMTPEAIASVLALACGHLGSGAEYLRNTVVQLEALGIRDSGLWRLQRLVAERIDAL